MNTCSPFITPPLPFCSQTISWVAQWHNYKQCHIYNIYIIIFICTYLYFFFISILHFHVQVRVIRWQIQLTVLVAFSGILSIKHWFLHGDTLKGLWNISLKLLLCWFFKINKGAFENITSIWNWNSNLYVLFVYIFCLALLTLFTKLASEVLWLFFQDTGQPRAILIVSLSTE